jgi:hypothetical protein
VARSIEVKEQFLTRCREALDDGSFLRLSLQKSTGPEDLINVRARVATIKGSPALSFVFHHTTKDITKNFPFGEALEQTRVLLGGTFRSATLFTTAADHMIEYLGDANVKIRSSRPTLKQQSAVDHNREKNYLVPLSAPFLKKMGIADEKNNLRPTGASKYRQINKFIEIIDSIIPESWRQGKYAPRIVDFGSGKSYLTFAVYDYLTRKLGIRCTVTGVELREELVAASNQLAEECEYTDLHFTTGAIASFAAESVDLVIALHACDTATDDALLFSVRVGAKVVMVAPCCHKYVRKHMKLPLELRPVFRHGILEERIAESLTDGLRALFLQVHGYKTKVFEFVSSEHTTKNVMITGRYMGNRSVAEETKLQIESIKRQFGIVDFYLDRNGWE